MITGGKTINFIASLVLLVQHCGMPEVQAPPSYQKQNAAGAEKRM